jgi:hypothetical protein
MNKWLYFRLSDIFFLILFLLLVVEIDSFITLYNLVEEDVLLASFFVACFITIALGLIFAILHRAMFKILKKHYNKRQISLNAIFVKRKHVFHKILQIIFLFSFITLIYLHYQFSLNSDFELYHKISFSVMFICLYLFFNFIAAQFQYSHKWVFPKKVRKTFISYFIAIIIIVPLVCGGMIAGVIYGTM